MQTTSKEVKVMTSLMGVRTVTKLGVMGSKLGRALFGNTVTERNTAVTGVTTP